MGSFKDKNLEIMKFAALCLLAVAAAHPHKGKWGHKRHNKERDHPVIDWAVDTYKEIETAINEIVSDVPTVPTQW